MSTVLDRPSYDAADTSTGAGERRTDANLEKRRGEIKRKFQEIYIKKTYDELGAASFEETMNMRAGLNQLPLDEDEISGWETYWNGTAQDAMRSAHKLYHEELMDKLLRGRTADPKWISVENMKEWSDRFKDPGVLYKQKETFIRDKMPGYIERWKNVAQKRAELLKNPAVKSLTTAEVPKLRAFLDENAFLNLHYNDRASLVAMVETALGTTGSTKQLYLDAKATLEEAADEGVIGHHTVGGVLQKIFAEKNLVLLAKFVRGKEGFTLRDYIRKCRALRSRFDGIETRRKEKGTPHIFHFVKLDVFLSWDYKKQKSYLSLGEHSFESLASTPPLFLKIRHALDAKDWDEAGECLDEAEMRKGEWSETRRQELVSMRQFWKEHCTDGGGNRGEKPQAMQILERMRGAMGQIKHASIRDRLRRGMEWDSKTLWVLCTMYYNWEWCRRHGYSSDHIDHVQKAQAKNDTYRHMEFGQPRDHIVNEMSGDTSRMPAARTDRDTRSAQGIFVDEHTDNRLLARMAFENKDNWSFWYWTRMVEKDIPFAEIQYLVYNVFPILKQGMRQLDSMGIRYTDKGPTGPSTTAATW